MKHSVSVSVSAFHLVVRFVSVSSPEPVMTGIGTQVLMVASPKCYH